MEQKYIVYLSGEILKASMAEAVEGLSSIFLDKSPTEIERLIVSKATIKKSVDLELANKVKSRIEQAGAACTISLEVSAPEINKLNTIPKEPEPRPVEIDSFKSESNHKNEGAIYISIALITIIVLFFSSKGYHPEYGLLLSVKDSMVLYDDHPFGCKPTSYPYAQENPDGSKNYAFMGKPVGGCAESFKLTIKTKYFLLIALLILIFGIGRYLNHFKSINEYSRGIRKSITEG